MRYVGTATGCSPFNKSVCRTRKSHNGLWHSDFPGNYRQSFLPRYRQSRHPPQSSLPEPLEADGAACEPWDDAGVQIAALVGAPGNKAGAPIHPALEAIPGPIGPTAYIAELGESHRYDLPITCANAV